MRLLRPSMPLTNAAPHLSTVVVLLIGPGILDSMTRNVDRSDFASCTSGGSIQLMWADPTSTPRWAPSRRSVLAKYSAPAFDAWYAASPGDDVNAASDDTTST